MPDIILNPPKSSYIPVSTIFIDKYMPKSHGDYVKVYLTLLMLSYTNSKCSTDAISKKLNIPESEVVNALLYWHENNLIFMSNTGEITFNDFTLNEEDCFFMLSNNNNDIYKELEKTLGRPLTPSDFKFFSLMMDKFKFPLEVLNFLIEYCVSKKDRY